MSDYGQPLFKQLKYCTRCCMPETEEGQEFDEMGICRPCRSAEQKIHINWVEREKILKQILDETKAKSGNNYDCVVGISGGKDSTFQLHVLTKIYGMKPLAVTFNHNWYSETGKYNLWNTLEKLNVDHVMFTPNRDLVNRIARKSLEAIGDSCWHCHSGAGMWVVKTAFMFKIPLIVWGESEAENSGWSSYYDRSLWMDTKETRDYFDRISAKVKPDDMVCEYLSGKDLYPFKLPTYEEVEKIGLKGIHLGDFIFWDDERQVEFVKKEYGWKETEVDGTYKRYKSAECIMTGIHDYSKFIKRGFGRGSDHASMDVRAGLLTREEGFELAKKHDSARPKMMDEFLKITNLTEEEFINILKKQRKGPALKLP